MALDIATSDEQNNGNRKQLIYGHISITKRQTAPAQASCWPSTPRSLDTSHTKAKAKGCDSQDEQGGEGMTFKRAYTKPARVYPSPIPLEHRRGATYARQDEPTGVIEKEDAQQHSGYMDIVRSLPCAHCGKGGPSQFCHSDEGKGMSIKSDCRLGWPGCAACHHAIGTERIYPREDRRLIEAKMARQTRAEIINRGLWPARLPRWTE